MTLVVVLLFGLGSVLILSAIETDPATGKSVSVLLTIANVWNNKLDVSQPASGGQPTSRRFAAPVALQGNAVTAAYLASHGSL